MTNLEREDQWELVAALAALAIVAYLPSFNAWFFLDDFRIILENPALQNAFDPIAVWRFSEHRFIASLTFAANYTLHGDAVFGYHLVNFLIHCAAATALGLLAQALLRTPAVADRMPVWAHWIPWIAAAVFLLHPLQTQAVTYIVQRYTSLMALFYLAALAAFAWGRLRGSWKLYLTTVVFAGLAILSKQTAATLPLAIVLLELMFFRRLSPRGVGLVALSGALGAILTFWLLSLPAFDITGLTRETGRISRVDYLATQMEVLWRYIGLFFLVGEQRLEYAIPVAEGFTAPLTFTLALGHLVAVTAGFLAWRRAPLVAFGLLFYYLAHAIESSFLPIIDVAFEHRTYLPNTGLALATATGLAWLATRPVRWRAGAVVTFAVLLLLAGTTWARNSLWADQIGFLRAETRLSPTSQRAWTSLGKELMRGENFREALKALEKAADIAERHEDGQLRPPTLLNMIFALHYTERNREAVELANNVPLDNFNRTEQAFYYEARGRARFGLGEYRKAREDLTRSARLNPTINAMAFLAAAEYQLGNHARAEQLARQVLQAAPENPLARDLMRRMQ
jgi:protein O-mannosyl-transferase